MTMSDEPTQDLLRAEVEARLGAGADPGAAPAMQAYMKTQMPFRGVKSPRRKPVERALRDVFRPASQGEYEGRVRAVWTMPHREDKYVAIALACAWRRFVRGESLPLYESMIREGAWWDLVDEIAVHLVGELVRKEPDRLLPTLDHYAVDDDLWIRRTALIAQLRCKAHTDTERLGRYCLALSGGGGPSSARRLAGRCESMPRPTPTGSAHSWPIMATSSAV